MPEKRRFVDLIQQTRDINFLFLRGSYVGFAKKIKKMGVKSPPNVKTCYIPMTLIFIL